MKTAAIAAYQKTTQRLIDVLGSFSQEQINNIPFEGSWTPGQVADHILKSQSGIPQILYGKTEPAKRGAGEKEEDIKKVFLDFSIRMASPEFVLPSDGQLNEGDLLNSLKKISLEIIAAVEALAIENSCLGFELPGFGAFTRLEWLYFVIYHTQRHIRQLERMQLPGLIERENQNRCGLAANSEALPYNQEMWK